MTDSKSQALTSPSLYRRIAVMVYDALLLLAVLFLASALALPLNRGEAIGAENLLFQLYLLGVGFLYFGWFWTRSGQTVAMRAWRLRVVSADGYRLSWGLALRRYLAVLLPAAPALLWMAQSPAQSNALQLWTLLACWLSGFLWVLVDREKRAWHDLLSATRIVLEPKQKPAADTQPE